MFCWFRYQYILIHSFLNLNFEQLVLQAPSPPHNLYQLYQQWLLALGNALSFLRFRPEVIDLNRAKHGMPTNWQTPLTNNIHYHHLESMFQTACSADLFIGDFVLNSQQQSCEMSGVSSATNKKKPKLRIYFFLNCPRPHCYQEVYLNHREKRD